MAVRWLHADRVLPHAVSCVLSVPYAGCALQTLWRLDCLAKPPLHVSPHAHVLKGACVASNTACAGSGSAATHCAPLLRTRSATPPAASTLFVDGQHAVSTYQTRCSCTVSTLSARRQHAVRTRAARVRLTACWCCAGAAVRRSAGTTVGSVHHPCVWHEGAHARSARLVYEHVQTEPLAWRWQH